MSALADRLRQGFGDEEYAHAYMDGFTEMLLAGQLRKMREARGWSQRELAKRAGMQQSRISSLEQEDYTAWTLGTLRKLSKAFDVSLSVKFCPFSESILEVANLRESVLNIKSRSEDLRDFSCTSLSKDGDGVWRTIRQPSISIVPPRSSISLPVQVSTARMDNLLGGSIKSNQYAVMYD